jgi:hypothetical protein
MGKLLLATTITLGDEEWGQAVVWRTSDSDFGRLNAGG